MTELDEFREDSVTLFYTELKEQTALTARPLAPLAPESAAQVEDALAMDTVLGRIIFILPEEDMGSMVVTTNV